MKPKILNDITNIFAKWAGSKDYDPRVKYETALEYYANQVPVVPKPGIGDNNKLVIAKTDGSYQLSDFNVNSFELKPNKVEIEETEAVIKPADNTIYKCAELVSLTISNPPATGTYSIVFTSGSTATLIPTPSSVLGLESFTPVANTIYEINVLDNRAVIGSWAVSGR